MHTNTTDHDKLRTAAHRVLCAMLLLAAPLRAHAQSADNVLLVINEDSPASVQIGEYYARQRAIESDHIIRIKAPTTETIQRVDYEQKIEAPIGTFLVASDLQDRILYIVLTKGVPLRVRGTGGRDGTVASVDSELTLLYRRLLGLPIQLLGRTPNPYFLDAKDIAQAQPFSRTTSDIYLVTRLDGFSVDDVIELIDRARQPSASGEILLDEKGTLFDRGGDQWLEQAADRLKQGPLADHVVLEETAGLVATTKPVMGYYSWGSNDPANQLRRFGLTFAPGAIGGMFVSTDGRTFAEPPADWRPSDPGGGRTFGGSFQSLAGDLIRDGITGVAAHVDEPFLDATIRPQILFPAYVGGFNLAESFYLAMPFLSWQTVVIGDPLCVPFPRRQTVADMKALGTDPESEMPTLFTARRLELLGANLKPAGLKVALKLERETARGITDTFEARLIRATELEPRYVKGQLTLAAYYGARKDFDKAIERFRLVVAAAPENYSALNDLAYLLAEEKHQPQEGLPFAERAAKLSATPEVLDTLGWIYHLLGQDERGSVYVERALAAGGANTNVDILIHAATIHWALKQPVTARSELQRALALNPALAKRADVQALQSQLR